MKITRITTFDGKEVPQSEWEQVVYLNGNGTFMVKKFDIIINHW